MLTYTWYLFGLAFFLLSLSPCFIKKFTFLGVATVIVSKIINHSFFCGLSKFSFLTFFVFIQTDLHRLYLRSICLFIKIFINSFISSLLSVLNMSILKNRLVRFLGSRSGNTPLTLVTPERKLKVSRCLILCTFEDYKEKTCMYKVPKLK